MWYKNNNLQLRATRWTHEALPRSVSLHPPTMALCKVPFIKFPTQLTPHKNEPVTLLCRATPSTRHRIRLFTCPKLCMPPARMDWNLDIAVIQGQSSEWTRGGSSRQRDSQPPKVFDWNWTPLLMFTQHLVWIIHIQRKWRHHIRHNARSRRGGSW